MHVLSVIHYPIYGGPHHRNALVIPELRSRGIETTVLLPDEPGNAYDHLVAQGVRVARVPLRRLRAVRDPVTHLRFAGQFRADVRRLRAIIKAREVDLVLVNGLINPHSALAGHLERVPLVWQLLDTFAPMPVRRAMMPLVTEMADALMSSGTAVAAAHPGAASFAERLVPFFPAVDMEMFVNTRAAREAARKRLGLSNSCLVVGNVGNLNLMKGHDLFVQAAGELRRHRPDVRFVILGAQSPSHAHYVKGLMSAAEDLGLQIGRDLLVVDPGTDVAQFAPAFDVFWLTSHPRSEGVPTVVGEAMALELPVIATRVGSVAEAVEDGVTGHLVRPRDARALVHATLPYLDDPRLRRAAGDAGRRRAQELYSRETCAARHEHAFSLAVAHRGARRLSLASRS